MKKMNKKGFTIVELVIVIAVIAILAAVMIPTFGSLVKKANESATQQAAAAAFKEAYALDLSDGKLDGKDKGEAIEGAKFVYTVDEAAGTYTFRYTENGYTATYSGADWVVDTAAAATTPAETPAVDPAE